MRMRSTVWICLFLCAFLGATVSARYHDDYEENDELETGGHEDDGLIPVRSVGYEDDLSHEAHDYPDKVSNEDTSLQPKSAVAYGGGNVVKKRLSKARISPTATSIRYYRRCKGAKRTKPSCKRKAKRRTGYSTGNAKQRRIQLQEEKKWIRRGGKRPDHKYVRN